MGEIKLLVGVTPSEHEIARARVLWVVKRQLNPFYTIVHCLLWLLVFLMCKL
jgi:hypothetical protein